jgi:hypothetical protein
MKLTTCSLTKMVRSRSLRISRRGLRYVLDDGGLNAFRWFIEDKHLGIRDEARPIASCCCWPPERFPPLRFRMSKSTGKRA